jgi:hypothetical protein
MKRRFGWISYFMPALKNMHSKRITGNIDVNHPVKNRDKPIKKVGLGVMRKDAENTFIYNNVKFRSLLVGNCGEIPGFKLLPDAIYNDGLLDVAAIDTKGGIVGWSKLLSDVFFQRFNLRIEGLVTKNTAQIDHVQCKAIHVRTNEPAYVQLDGEILGKTTDLNCYVEHKALPIFTPEV